MVERFEKNVVERIYFGGIIVFKSGYDGARISRKYTHFNVIKLPNDNLIINVFWNDFDKV